MTPVIHRAPLGTGPLPCCGRYAHETTRWDLVTGTGTVTCPGPPVGRVRGNLEELLAEADAVKARHRAALNATGDITALVREADEHRGYWGDRTALLRR